MNYAFYIRALGSEQYEVRLIDFVGARAIYDTWHKARQGALNLFLEAVQGRFEDNQFVPWPSDQLDGQLLLCVPEVLIKQIKQHNDKLLSLGLLQDVSE